MLGVFLLIWAEILARLGMGSLMGSCIFRRKPFTNILVIDDSKLLTYFIVFWSCNRIFKCFFRTSSLIRENYSVLVRTTYWLLVFSGSEKIQVFRIFSNTSIPKRFEFFRIILNSWVFAIGLYTTDFGASFEIKKSHSLQVGSLTSVPLHFENLVYKLNSPRHRSSGCGV